MSTKIFEDRDNAAATVKRLNDELKALNDRLEAEPANGKLKERATNIAKGLTRAASEFEEADQAYQKHILEQVMNGSYSVEAGDSCGGAEGDRQAARRLRSGGDNNVKHRSALADAMFDAGFDLKKNPSVETKAFGMLEQLKATTVPGVADWNRRVPGTVIPLGRDTRFLFPFLNTEDAGTNASIQDFTQTVRSLTGTVKRTLNATSTKASLATTTTLVNEALVEFAVTLDDIPNALFQSVPQFGAYMAAEGEFQVMKAIDDHVMAQIVAATPANGITGTNLMTQIRNGIKAMRAVGAQPQLAVLNPDDSADLDTYQTADGEFIFPLSATNTASPLFGQQVVERIGAGTENPFLIDPSMLGVLHIGSVSFDADPYTGFKENLTTLRVEVKGLFHVRNAQGAYEIVA